MEKLRLPTLVASLMLLDALTQPRKKPVLVKKADQKKSSNTWPVLRKSAAPSTLPYIRCGHMAAPALLMDVDRECFKQTIEDKVKAANAKMAFKKIHGAALAAKKYYTIYIKQSF